MGDNDDTNRIHGAKKRAERAATAVLNSPAMRELLRRDQEHARELREATKAPPRRTRGSQPA